MEVENSAYYTRTNVGNPRAGLEQHRMATKANSLLYAGSTDAVAFLICVVNPRNRIMIICPPPPPDLGSSKTGLSVNQAVNLHLCDAISIVAGCSRPSHFRYPRSFKFGPIERRRRVGKLQVLAKLVAHLRVLTCERQLRLPSTVRETVVNGSRLHSRRLAGFFAAIGGCQLICVSSELSKVHVDRNCAHLLLLGLP